MKAIANEKSLSTWQSIGLLVVLLFSFTVNAQETSDSGAEKKAEKVTKKSAPKPVTVKNPETGDVYNFYFQKAPGPQTVQQGGGTGSATQTVQQAPAAREEISDDDVHDPARVGMKKPLIRQPKPEYYPTELALGFASVNDHSGLYSGVAVEGLHHFNKYFSVGGGILRAVNTESPNYYIQQTRTGLNAYDFHAFGYATPIHVRVFEHTLIEMGMGLGLMTASIANSPEEYRRGNTDKVITGGIAFRWAINFTSDFGMVGENRAINGDYGGSHNMFGMRYRF